MARNKSRPVYSGNGSKSFWCRIKALPEPHGEYLYAMAARLQDMECTVLNLFAEAETQTVLRQVVQEKRTSKPANKRR